MAAALKCFKRLKTFLGIKASPSGWQGEHTSLSQGPRGILHTHPRPPGGSGAALCIPAPRRDGRRPSPLSPYCAFLMYIYSFIYLIYLATVVALCVLFSPFPVPQFGLARVIPEVSECSPSFIFGFVCFVFMFCFGFGLFLFSVVFVLHTCVAT